MDTGIIFEKIRKASDLQKAIIQFEGVLEMAVIGNGDTHLVHGLKAALNIYKGYFCKELGHEQE